MTTLYCFSDELSVTPARKPTALPMRGLTKVLRPFWRMRRGLTLGAQGVIIDGSSRVLLVRHSYRPGWFFPGGGVEWDETIETALARELEEEVGVSLTGPASTPWNFCEFYELPRRPHCPVRGPRLGADRGLP